MADSTSLSILRQTPLSSSIATKEWTEDNFLPLSAQVRQAWYGECSTAQSTKAKTVEISGITELQTGLQVRIKFTTAQRASSPTLNINGLGGHPIIRNETTAVANYEWLAGEVIDLVFDGTAWIVSDGGIATTSYYGYTKLYNGATSTSTAYALAPAALNSYSENTVVGAPALLTSSTYSVGDRVRYQFNTYECISDVQTPGAWASISSHFKELDPIQIQIDNLSDAVANIDIPEVDGKFIPLSGNAIVANPFILSTIDPDNGLKETLNIESTEWGDRIAIGVNAIATGPNTIQLGNGSNSDQQSLKVWDYVLLKRGKIPLERIPDLPISSITNLQTTLNNKLSGVKMNGSNVTVTNGVADLSIVLTAHQSLSDLYVLSGEVVEGLSNVVIPKLDTISGLVEEEVDKVDEISAKFDDYSLTGHTHTSSDITNFPPIPTVNNGTLTIQKNGTLVQTFSANQSNSVTANISVPTKTSDLTNDSGFVVSSDLTKVMEYQGSVTNFSDLPNNASKGDVYNVVSANGDYPPGTNYAWSGTSWDPLGGSIDVSIFATVSALNKLSSEVVNGLSVEVNPKLSVIANSVEEEVAKLDELSAGLTAYAKLSDITEVPSDLSAFTNSPGYITQQSLSGLSDIYELSSETINGLSVVVNPKLSTIADKVEEEVAKLDELSGKLSAYALTSDIPLSVSELTNDAGYMTSYTETDPVFNNWLSGEKIYAGNEASATYLWDIAIGQSAKSAAGIAIGLSATATGSSKTGIPAIAIGDRSVASSLRSTAIGFLTQASNAHSLALGSEAKALTSFAIQLGKGTNSEVSSLQVFDWQLLDSNGDIPYARLSANVPTPEETDPVFNNWLSGTSVKIGRNSSNTNSTSDSSAIAIGQNAAVNGNVGIAIGYAAKTKDGFALGLSANAAAPNDDIAGIAIGYNTYAYGNIYAEKYGIAIGDSTSATTDDTVALGDKAMANNLSSIQLGRGTNNTQKSLQVWDYQLLDSNGNIPYARLSSTIKYRIVTPAQTTSGTSVSAMMQDNAINHVSLASTVTTTTISFPPKVTGYARDFFVRLTVTGSTVPAITWQEADGSAIDFDVDDDSWSEIEQGVNILMFTETAQ